MALPTQNQNAATHTPTNAHMPIYYHSAKPVNDDPSDASPVRIGSRTEEGRISHASQTSFGRIRLLPSYPCTLSLSLGLGFWFLALGLAHGAGVRALCAPCSVGAGRRGGGRPVGLRPVVVCSAGVRVLGAGCWCAGSSARSCVPLALAKALGFGTARPTNTGRSPGIT